MIISKKATFVLMFFFGFNAIAFLFSLHNNIGQTSKLEEQIKINRDETIRNRSFGESVLKNQHDMFKALNITTQPS